MMARRTIARLQQRELAAGGAQPVLPRTPTALQGPEPSNKAMEDMLVQALLTVRKGKAQCSQQHGRLNQDESKADPTSMGCFLVHNNGTLPLIEQSLHRLLVATAPMLKAGDYLK